MFVEYFVKKPAATFSIFVILMIAGLFSIGKLPLRLFPETTMYSVNVSAFYPGASSDVMDSRVTSILQESIEKTADIDYISSMSAMGYASVTVHLRLGADYQHVFVNVLQQVKSAVGLPVDLEPPTVQLIEPERAPDFALAFYSAQMHSAQTSEYLTRIIKPKLESIDGVSWARVLGDRYTARIWFKPKLLLAHNMSVTDVLDALHQHNIQPTAGSLKNSNIHFNIDVNTAATSIDELANIQLSDTKQGVVRLSDVAKVELGSADSNRRSIYKGVNSTVVSVKFDPRHNPIEAAEQIKRTLKELSNQFPYDLQADVIVDSSEYIAGSLEEVIHTMLLSLLIVFIMLYVCTGNIQSVVIPIVTIPLSLLSIAIVLLLLGYSLNSLTLLAMVLAIGIVVDDAIVVYENILMRLEASEPLYSAVVDGTTEILKPIIAVTATFSIIYVPIMFVGGVIEELFTEFAVTLAGSVIISGFIAVMLTPTLCLLLVKEQQRSNGVSRLLEANFTYLKKGYQYMLTGAVRHYRWLILVWVLACGVAFYLPSKVVKETAPAEDQGMLIVFGSVQSSKSNLYVNGYMNELERVLRSIDEVENFNYITGNPTHNQFVSYVRLKSWYERQRTSTQIQQELSAKLKSITGLRAIAISPSYLPDSTGLPFQIVVKHKEQDYKSLDRITDALLSQLRRSGQFAFVFKDLKYESAYYEIKIDKEMARRLEVDTDELATTLSLLYSDRHVQMATFGTNSYQVVPMVEPKHQFNIDNDLLNTHVRSKNGELIPLSSFARVELQVRPSAIKTFQGRNAVMISGVLLPHTSMEQALRLSEQALANINPFDVDLDYAGETRQLIQQQDQTVLTFGLGIMSVFLVLIFLYGRGSDPLIILLSSTPLSLFGCFTYLYVTGQSLNIFTQIAVLTVLGLIGKHGILIVKQAEVFRAQQLVDHKVAITQAAVMRFRAIFMTTLSMVLGALPLYFSSGPGAVGREQMGGVIIWGMAFGTVLTLIILPAIYLGINGLRMRLTNEKQCEVTLGHSHTTKSGTRN
ncbi:efflux RND transporter permease subunit [Pseudoalteromonas aurantia]|uniref:Uncharacterized protein n=1 Tax=Pseudoalteromonas aurantia 208 TaxID=1314867 RepID=A0ABR9E604_9GAMM|nr:efflux RND transporter permease subunit [Pseudoalteromonas aurantia]MBE0366414.1 hypothetical protein [Pseudoalteromonas aurantia 208]